MEEVFEWHLLVQCPACKRVTAFTFNELGTIDPPICRGEYVEYRNGSIMPTIVTKHPKLVCEVIASHLYVRKIKNDLT